MNIYQILCLIGIPSVITCINTWIYNKTKTSHTRHVSLELGVQALLRSQMINEYYTWNRKGYAPIHIKENFENCWQQYHNLGANGVMDGIHEEFMSLSTEPPKQST